MRNRVQTFLSKTLSSEKLGQLFFAYLIFLQDSGVLRVLSRDPSTPRRAQMLQEMHFRNIAQRATLRKRTEEAARYLEATRIQTSAVYTEEFTVTEDLMGLSIGTHGVNIQQARKIEGIKNRIRQFWYPSIRKLH